MMAYTKGKLDHIEKWYPQLRIIISYRWTSDELQCDILPSGGIAGRIPSIGVRLSR